MYSRKIALYAVLSFLTVVFCLAACGKPKIADVMPKEGVKCKAEITMPNGRKVIFSLPIEMAKERWFVVNREGDKVEVEVRIFDCK